MAEKRKASELPVDLEQVAKRNKVWEAPLNMPEPIAKNKRCYTFTRYVHEEDGKVDIATVWQRLQKRLCGSLIAYAGGQIEVCPKTQELHIQGVVHFTANTTKKSTASYRLGDRGVHCEQQKMDMATNQRYIAKPGGVMLWEHGEPLDISRIGQGKRNDLVDARNHYIKHGELSTNMEFPDAMIRYGRGIRASARAAWQTPDYELTKRETLIVVVLWGESGAGKSHQAMQLARNRHWRLFGPVGNGASDINGYKKPYFNGYNGEEAICFAEYNGWMEFTTLLQITDCMPYKAEERNGEYLQAHWKMVVFTCNKHPKDWYPHVRWDSDYGLQLRRRITNIIRLERPPPKATCGTA